MENAVKNANMVASISVQNLGTQSSYPALTDLPGKF